MSDDFLRGRHNKQHDGSYQKDRHHKKEENNDHYRSRKHEDIGQQIISMFKANKKLLIAAIIGGIVLLGIVIFVLISLLPLISSFLANISKGGLKGAVDSGMPIINKLLSGAGK
jgi:hypothetical protein